ncbi:MAG TPA: site-2 protease family protein [Anaeromyxobacteraceae bacterium]|nr:site-2 protease family protein [Anaeromyxobacteraceae bacterium]
MEPAVFRPVRRGQARLLVLGALGGALVGAVVEIPLLVAALFGAVAAAIATSARHVSGLRVVATAAGLEVRRGEAPLSAPWERLQVGFGRATRPDGGDLQRVAVVAAPDGRSFAFGDFGGLGPCDPVRGADGRPVEVVDLEQAPVLLALLVQRVPAWHVLPSWLVDVAPPPPLDALPPAPEGLPGPGTPAGAPAAAPPHAARPARLGLFAVVAKLGGKLLAGLGKVGAGALKALKGTNLAMAAASAAAYSILFTWQFGVLLLLQLFVHEYGHVHAMRRTGMRVRGMYFIPLLGALAVTDDAFTSRRQQAYVALNGPLWGSLFTLLPLGAWWLTGSHFWAAVAATWAVINLFNLLPITPLDGGRAMSAFANSFSSSLGVAVGVLGLAGAVALGMSMGFSLIWLVALVGAMELVAESQSRAGGRALRLLPEPARFGPAHYQYLRAVVGPPPGGADELGFARQLVRMEQAARVEPMGKWQIVRWGLLYAGLAAGLLAVVYFLSHLPGAGEAASILS